LFGVAADRLGQRGERLRQRAVLLAVQAVGECQSADKPVSDPLGVRARGGQVEEARLDIYEPPRFFEAFLRGRAYTEPTCGPSRRERSTARSSASAACSGE